MKKVFLFVSGIALMLSATGCERPLEIDLNEIVNPHKDLQLSTKSKEFVQKGQDFSFEMIDRINAGAKGDYIVSPLSLQFLLGMLLYGADGQTSDQICNVLGYGKGEVEAVNEYSLSMLKQLPNLDGQTKLKIGNAIFASKSVSLLGSYKTDVSKYYKAEVSSLDFTSPSALNTINGWCNRQTEGMIPKILDNVDDNALVYLLNALYFKGQWTNKFKTENTAPATFTRESGDTQSVQMMKQYKSLAYQDNDVFKAVKMPYGNGNFAMYAFLPQEGYGISDITASLKDGGWDAFRRTMVGCEVDLWIPRFESKYSIKLNEMLIAMGMPDAFSMSNANFSAMSKTAMYLDYVQQNAIIKVNEEGTEAAAITIGTMAPTAVDPGEEVVFHADHPFLYLITESSTGAVLFAGRYTGE